MDLGHIPELANHFVQAASVFASHLPDLLPTSAGESMRNVYAALFEQDAMTLGQKSFQAVKFAAAASTLCASIMTENISGIVGSLIAEGEVFYDLDRAGEEFRRAHPQP
jgi:hypothetical protein